MRCVDKTRVELRLARPESSVKKNLVEKAPFRLRKKVRFGLQSKKAVFDWQIRLCTKWLKDSFIFNFIIFSNT